MRKRVTMTMIAEACGTSIGTVDRALNDRAEINPETKQLILAAAEELGYQRKPSAAHAGSPRRIAVIYPRKPEEFYMCIAHGIDKAAQKMAPAGIEIDQLFFDAMVPSSELDLLKSLDVSRYAGIAINPLGSACAEYINAFAEKGIPVVTFNNDLPNSRRLFYVGCNSLQSGRMAGDVMGTLIGGRGGIAVLGNFTHTMPFFERFDGFCQVVHDNYPDATIYSSADCKLDPGLTERNIRTLLTQAPDLRGIFCTGLSTTIGTVEALKRMNCRTLTVVGYDVCDKTAEMVMDGWCQALIYQDPYQQGYQATKLLCRHVLDGWTPPQDRLFIESLIAFRQNVENYTGGVGQWDLSI